MWRMPLFNLYSKQVKEAGHLADLNNISHSRAGGSCTAAAFLRVSQSLFFFLLFFIEKFKTSYNTSAKGM